MGDHFRPSLAAKSAVITDASLFSMPVSKHPADQLHRPHSLSLLSFSQDDIPTGKAIRPQNEAHPTRKLCGVRKWNQIYVKSTYLHAKAEGKRQINIQSYWIQWNFLRRYFMWIKESTLTHKEHNGPKKIKTAMKATNIHQTYNSSQSESQHFAIISVAKWPIPFIYWF